MVCVSPPCLKITLAMLIVMHQSSALEMIENGANQVFSTDPNDPSKEAKDQFLFAPIDIKDSRQGPDGEGTIKGTSGGVLIGPERATLKDTLTDSGMIRETHFDWKTSTRGQAFSQDSSATKSARWFFESPNLNVKVKPKINFQPHQPKDSSDGEVGVPEITIEFRSGVNLLTVDLHPTRDLLASTYEEPPSRSTQDQMSWFRCEWQGIVRGFEEEESIVALSLCPVIRGIMAVGDVELIVEAAPGSTTPEDLHQITLNTPEVTTSGGCGVRTWKNKGDNQALNDDYSLPANHSSQTSRERRQAFSGQHGPLWTHKDALFIELVLVVDNNFYNDFRPDVYNRCRAIINIVNAIYRRIGVVVVLTDIEVWESYNKISVTKDYNHTLTLFSPYREELLKAKPHINNDNTMFMTTVDFINATVGYAYVAGMCSFSSSVGVVQDKKKGHIGSIATTIAHEMGHNLGMSHDDASCSCKTRRCIMAAQSTSMFRPDIDWSSCSRDVIQAEKDSVRFRCLKNIPIKYYNDNRKTCGNGIIDAGEQCDCGPREFCHNKCCNASTCLLAVNATCATGVCCNPKTCHPHDAGTTCRASKAVCDLPEFCSGNSEYCPVDVHTRDGTPCDRAKGYCYLGVCGSPSAQCKKVWGPSAIPSDRQCRTLNEKGDESGNCGWTDYTHNVLKKCPKSNLDCGTLHCQEMQSEKPILKGSFRYGWSTFGRKECHHILGDDKLPDYFWLAPNGSPCGKNKDKMCVDRECKQITPSNGVTVCPKQCNNQGICNSRGNCHCNPGFAPPDCTKEGHGGSYDSNHINPRNGNLVEDGIFIFLAILIPIIACICCCWEKIRMWWEQEGHSSLNSACPCCAECLNTCCCPMMSKFTNWFVTVIPLKKKNSHSNKQEITQVVDGTEASTICQVSLDMNEEAQTNSWGVADERLFTEVYKVTPKNSPDFSRKIMMPSSAPIYHHKSTEALDRTPTYQHQSVSLDSGCVSDEDVSIQRPLSSHMSMSSLIGAFTRIGNKSVKHGSTKDVNKRAKAFGSQKSIPLSRYVVDPLAGNRSSRHGTPPPDNIRYSFSRSVSTDATSSMRVHKQGPPIPPSSGLKPHKSDDNLHKISKQPKKRWSLLGRNATGSDESSISNKGNQEANSEQERRPMLPPQIKPMVEVPSRGNIARAAPPPPHPPSKNKPQEERKGPVFLSLKSPETSEKRNPDVYADKNSVCSHSKKPMMPPRSGLKSPPSDKSMSPSKTPATVSSKAGPIFPLRPKNQTGNMSSNNGIQRERPPMASKDPRETPVGNGRVNVKALAKKLEQ